MNLSTRLILLLIKVLSFFLRPIFAIMVRTPYYKKAVSERFALMGQEEATLEEAEWFGITGLGIDIERELPRYLRREFGESLFDEGSLKAADIKYEEVFSELGLDIPLQVHYWRLPARDGEAVYAYIEVTPDGETCLGWGNKEPPSTGGLVV